MGKRTHVAMSNTGRAQFVYFRCSMEKSPRTPFLLPQSGRPIVKEKRMIREVLAGKIHRATVTQAALDYVAVLQ